MNLHDLFHSLTVEEREALAKKVPTDPGYLWQLANQWRDKKPSLGLMQKLVAAEPRLTLGELVEEFAGVKDEPHGTANGKRRKPAATERKQPKPTDKPSRNKGR